MLHVLPSGTYGLRPAVNRSNTRTRCAPLCVYWWSCVLWCRPYSVHPAPRPPQPHPALVAILSTSLRRNYITKWLPPPHPVYSRWCYRRRIHRPRSFPKPLRPVTAYHREREFSKKSRDWCFGALKYLALRRGRPLFRFFARRYSRRLSSTDEQYPANFGLVWKIVNCSCNNFEIFSRWKC